MWAGRVNKILSPAAACPRYRAPHTLRPVRPLAAWSGHPLAIGLASGLASLALLGRHVLPLGGMVEPGGDYGLMVWNLWIVNRALTHGENPYFTPLVYYPLGARLVKHTLVLGYWPVTFATELLTAGDPSYPVYAYRISILLSFTLALALTYAVLRRLGYAPLVAAVPAFAYAFCDFNVLHVPHLNHLGAAFFLPLCALLLVRLLQQPGKGRAVAAAFVLALGVYFTELVVFLWIAAVAAAVAACALPAPRADLRRLAAGLGTRGVALAVMAFALTLAPFVVSWMLDSGKAPSPRQASNWSANLAAFVVPRPDTTPLYGSLFAAPSAALSKGIAGQEVFLGFPLLLLAVLGLARRPRGWMAVAALVALLFLALSLGPTLLAGPVNTGWPLPYALLMKVPPFDMGRTPVRCVLLAVFALVFPAAAGLAWAREAVRARAGAGAARAVVAFFLAWTVAEVYAPAAAAQTYTPPAALGRLVPGPVINVPISVFDGRAVFLQTFHGHPIATGFVSRRTPAQLAHVRALDTLLNDDPAAFARELDRIGVRNVILAPGTPPDVADSLFRTALNVVDLRAEPPVH